MARKEIQLEIITEPHLLPSLFRDGKESIHDVTEVKIENESQTFSNLSAKDKKELFAFKKFSGTSEFLPCLAKLGVSLSSKITIILNSDGDDPPDVTLVNPQGENIGIEITDYPQNTSVLLKAFNTIKGPSSIPGVSQTGTNLRKTIEYMEKPISGVAPQMVDSNDETQDLKKYLIKQLDDKDQKGNVILLLDGSVFEFPEVDLARSVISQKKLVHIKCVVLLLPDKSVPIYI